MKWSTHASVGSVAAAPAARRSYPLQHAQLSFWCTLKAIDAPFPASAHHLCLFFRSHPQQERQGHIDTELATVISSISLACKQIAAAVGRSGISSLTGVAGTGENVQVSGERMLLPAAQGVCLQ